MTAPTPTGQLPTRQQLDEIDALLRRMLSLPSMANEPAEPTMPGATFGSTTAPMPAIREIAPQEAPPVSDPIVRSWRVDWPQTPSPAPSQSPSVVAWGTPVSDAVQHTAWSPPTPPTAPAPPTPTTSPGSQVPFAIPMPSNDLRSLPLATAVLPSSVPLVADDKTSSVFIWFLILINGAFNLLTYLVGPLGTWLRGSGRVSLGWMGILMVLGSAVWAAGNWYGYDWPKLPLDRLRIPR